MNQENRKKNPSKFTKAEKSPGFLLWQVTNKWQKKQREALEPFGLTHVQFVLLAGLYYLKKVMNQTVTQIELAEFTSADPMMTSQVLRVLLQKGIIQRQRSYFDKRAFELDVTPIGEDLAKKTFPVVEKVDEEFFGVLENKSSSDLSENQNFTKSLHLLSINQK